QLYRRVGVSPGGQPGLFPGDETGRERALPERATLWQEIHRYGNLCHADLYPLTALSARANPGCRHKTDTKKAAIAAFFVWVGYSLAGSAWKRISPSSTAPRITAPRSNWPCSSCWASGFSTHCWMARLRGRAPYTGSNPIVASFSIAS